MAHLESALLRDVYDHAQAARWAVTPARLDAAIERSIAKAFPTSTPGAPELAKYVRALHLEDLALAAACEDGHEGAWEHFVREFRPHLYRAAAAIDPGGGARDLADALYADLFGLKERDGARQSLFRYFHGRSSLLTWLRSVLSQRHVDRIRAGRRTDPLPDDEQSLPAPQDLPAPDRPRQVAALVVALAAAITRLTPRDRLRLACYYAQNLTLAQIGRMTGEHEATVSRHLTRARKDVRQDIEAQLRQQGMADAEIAECIAEAVDDVGALDVADLLSDREPRKDSLQNRST